jgi:chitin disaccharide deacetylase
MMRCCPTELNTPQHRQEQKKYTVVIKIKKYLIINADDFGLSPSVNAGILEAYENGSISSATMMVNLPGFEDAVRIALLKRKLGVGLHFNLTYGSPVSAPENVPSLVNESGNFSSDFERWTEEDVHRELKKQWRKMRDGHIRPTHIDSHQHIQRFPVVYRPMVELAQRKKIAMRKMGWEPKILDITHPKSADRFILDVYFDGDGMKRLKNHLKLLHSGITELMCHPGYVDKYVYRISEWTEVREKECAVFCHSKVPYWIQKYNISLCHYGDF